VPVSQRLRIVVVLIVLSFLPSVSGAEAFEMPSVSRLPLLWTGLVLSADGHPAKAHLNAFIRPPASAIPGVDSGVSAPPSIPLASTTTGGDGRFELRAELPAVPAEYRPDGWLHVMVLATGHDGSWMVANDSMRHVPPSAAAPGGEWLSTIAAEEKLRSLLADPLARTSAIDRLVTEDLSSRTERPDILQLVRPGPEATAGEPGNRWKAPGDPYVGCSALAVEGRQEAFRTISDIDVGPAWSYILKYTETKSTSWDLGVEQSGGQWKAAGTSSFSQSHGKGFDAEYGPYPARFRESYQVELLHAKVLWRCASKNSPGPFYVRTVEAENWGGGTFNQGDPVVPCNPRHRKPIAGRTTGWRDSDRASKYSASGGAFGFEGQAAVTYSKVTRLGWKNHLEPPRDVCGESGNPFEGRTRVAAMDEHL
jgi:hypothetical protein